MSASICFCRASTRGCSSLALSKDGSLSGRDTARPAESDTQRQRGQGGGLREALRRDQIYEAETAPPAATIIGIAFLVAIGGASMYKATYVCRETKSRSVLRGAELQPEAAPAPSATASSQWESA